MSRLNNIALPGTQVDPLYPDSDGRPMGDTDFHTYALNRLRDALEDHFAGSLDEYVASSLVMYYQQGDPQARRDPDVLVAKGVGKHDRRSYRFWEEKIPPTVLFEISSRDTWRADVNEKPKLYASLGVKEYFVYDPEGSYLDPVLQGFRRVKGKPVAMTPAADGSLVSKQLGLRLVPEGRLLRLIDLQTGQSIPTRVERNERTEQARQEDQRARQEAEQRAERAEQARREEQRARQEEQRARQEAEQRAEQLAEELRRLRELPQEGEGPKD
jgi:Uma2 family endonuclease